MIGCFAVDLVCSSAICASIYLYTVTHWGDQDYSAKQNSPLVINAIATGVVGFNVQIYLILRYYALSGNNIVSSILAVTSVGGIIGAIYVGVLIAIYDAYAVRSHLAPAVLTWSVMSCTTDWALVVVLVRILQNKRRNMSGRLSSTDGIIKRLISVAISTGAVTSMTVTGSMISFLAFPKMNMTLLFGFCTGRVYTLTMLYNINYSGGLHNSVDSDRRRRGLSGDTSSASDGTNQRDELGTRSHLHTTLHSFTVPIGLTSLGTEDTGSYRLETMSRAMDVSSESLDVLSSRDKGSKGAPSG